ncbi:hypothetical protein LDO26_06110 [Luteimonas sp. BDR2-5]|uniref:hypothetical protein n=1 Tax=Proluteimonas luteida TaxID=2878685 RepID=UPI001E3FADE2|nr:hypothetical protein [Luteimonas sp. BDR2-5]MCD9027776.1 hypothetical protein [Luteimonas sp. BDR2-5]
MIRVSTLSALALVAALAGCHSAEYRDTNAAVDANPLCASRPDQPGEPVSRDCERVREGRISSERSSQPIDFRPRRDD